MNEPSPFIKTPRPGYSLATIMCPKCRRCWVRQVPTGADEGNWLCPQGWNSTCPSKDWVRVHRPELITVHLLTGNLAFDDMDGHVDV